MLLVNIKIGHFFLSICLILLMPVCLAQSFQAEAIYQVCFTPGDDCTKKIVDEINNAKKSILVQAYSFTSQPIAKALVLANQRNVLVKVILDKSQYKSERYSSAKFLSNYKIPVWIDYKPAIAHNKIIIIDNQIVVTGSFNFTKAAQSKNAENVLIISDKGLASKYLTNWNHRLEKALPMTQYGYEK